MANYKLGKLPHKYDKRTLQLAKYLNLSVLPTPPDEYQMKLPALSMLLNDQLGDCAIASWLHMVQLWCFQNGITYNPTDADALSGYETQGYNPNDPNSDQGCVLLNVLNYASKNGIAGHKAGIFAQVDYSKEDYVRIATWLFGGLYTGVQLPVAAQNEPDVWEITTSGLSGDGTPGSWGGHAVPTSGYNGTGLNIISWGKPLQMKWDWQYAYMDESWAIISPDWISNPNKAPNGLDMQHLLDDYKLITA